MSPIVLGLDIGGANLKAATADKRAVTLPFPLWKEPDGLARKLAELVTHFDGVEEFAVTMTGELCDCYETKREGVALILTAVQNVSRCYPIRVWSTEGKFVTVDEAKQNHLKVAAANWHALATFAGRLVPERAALLIDIGSTTTDLIPIVNGEPRTQGKTDRDRMRHEELVYVGLRRTPVCSLLNPTEVAAEFFASTQDAAVLLGHIPEEPENTETADGRPLTKAFSHARLSRMLCSDPELTTLEESQKLADLVIGRLKNVLRLPTMTQLIQTKTGFYDGKWQPVSVILSGIGELVARALLQDDPAAVAAGVDYSLEFLIHEIISLNEHLGPTVSACAPAYALALLAQERRS